MLEVGRKYLDENGKTISLVVILAAVVVSAIALTVRSRAAAIEDTWRRRASLKFTDEKTATESLRTLGGMIKESTDEQFVLKGLVDQGTQALRFSRESALSPHPELNRLAREAFEQLLARFPSNPLAIGVAHCGLATVEENEFILDRDMEHKEKAEQHLTAVIENPLLSGMPFQGVALDRRSSLDDVFVDVDFKYEIPEEEPEQEAAAVPVEPADALTDEADALTDRADPLTDPADATTETAKPAEIDLSNIDLSKVPTIRAEAAPPEAETKPPDESTKEPAPAQDPAAETGSPKTEPANPEGE